MFARCRRWVSGTRPTFASSMSNIHNLSNGRLLKLFPKLWVAFLEGTPRYHSGHGVHDLMSILPLVNNLRIPTMSVVLHDFR